MKKLSCLAVLFVALGLIVLGCDKARNLMEASPSDQSGVISLAKATTSTIVQEIPIDPSSFFVPCALSGLGETVNLVGTLHFVLHVTSDGSGGFHLVYSFNPDGAFGIGEISGDVYRAVGVTRESLNIPSTGLPVTDTFVDRTRLVGPGPGNNFQIVETFHITVGKSGGTTVIFDKFSVDCS